MSFQGAAKSIKLWRRWEGEAGWKVRFDGPVMRLEVAEKAIGDDLLLFADPSSVAGIDATGEEGRKALLALPKGTKLYSAGVANLEDPAIVEALRNARVEALTVSDGGDLASLWRLPTVRLLDLGGEVKSLAPMASLQNLEAFYFRCRALEGEETLSQLPNLKDIAILHYKTKEIGFLRNLRSLRSLVFSRLIKTEIMADLTGLTNLESLSVGYLTDSDLGVNLEATSQVLGRLRRLRCYGGGAKHQDFPKLAPHLIGLKWSYAEASEFASMAGLRGLSTLALQNCENAKDFSALGALRHLRYLSVSRNPQLESLAFVENLPKLRYLSVLGCKVLADLKPIRGLREIESLVLEHCPLIADLEPLLGLTRLRALYFNGCSRVKVEELFKVLGRSSADQGRYLRVISLPQVVGEKELEMLANSWNFSSPGTLVLQDMPNLTRLDALVSGPKYIHVNNCLGIKTLDLSALAATNEIFLFACTQLQSLAVDEKKAKTLRLESLRIHGCRQLKDIECLKHASSLRNLELDECLSLASEQIIAVAKALPRCRVMVGNLSSMEEKFEAKLMLSEANRLRHEARIVFGAVDNPRINELYRGAAELGLAEAQYLLGEDLTRTKRDEKQKAEGVALMHKAASQGHLDAMEHLGRLYADGQGVVKDASKAVEWYRRAAVAGHTLAQYSLGMMYLDGNGVAKDRALAVKYFRDAAAKDYLPAIDRLKELGVSEKP